MTTAEAIAILRRIQEPEAWEPQINESAFEALDMAIEALEAQNAVVHMDLPKISEDDLKKMLTKMNHQQQLEWIVDGTIPNNFAKDTNVPSTDTISRQDAIDEITEYGSGDTIYMSVAELKRRIEHLPSAQPEIIRCKECEYGEQDEVGRWFCRSLGCQIGSEDGSGYCSDAERRTDDLQ